MLASVHKHTELVCDTMSYNVMSCHVVISQSNGTQIVISITSVVVECIVVSSYRSQIAVVV